MSRAALFTVYSDDDGAVIRWKHAGKRLIIKMNGVTEAQASQTAIPLLVQALASLRSIEAKNVTTVV